MTAHLIDIPKLKVTKEGFVQLIEFLPAGLFTKKMVCTTCGALIDDDYMLKHADFHSHVEEIAEDAADGKWGTVPIGG